MCGYEEECSEGGGANYDQWQTLQIQNKTPITGHRIQNLHVIKARRDSSCGLSNIYSTDIIYRSAWPICTQCFLMHARGVSVKRTLYTHLYTDPPARLSSSRRGERSAGSGVPEVSCRPRPYRDPTQTLRGLLSFLKTLSLICAHWRKLKTRTIKENARGPACPARRRPVAGAGEEGPRVAPDGRPRPGWGGRPPDDAPLQPGQQRLSLTLYEEDEEGKKKNKTPNAEGISVG